MVCYSYTTVLVCVFFFFFSSRRRHTRLQGDWSSDVCSSDLALAADGYGVIRWKQEPQFGHTAGVDFGNPDFVALARAFGCEGVRVNAAKELRPALADALRATVPVLIDCPVDYRENDRLTEY